MFLHNDKEQFRDIIAVTYEETIQSLKEIISGLEHYMGSEM